jgi:hypothetical protein
VGGEEGGEVRPRGHECFTPGNFKKDPTSPSPLVSTAVALRCGTGSVAMRAAAQFPGDGGAGWVESVATWG